jgi:hypothetical protein
VKPTLVAAGEILNTGPSSVSKYWTPKFPTPNFQGDEVLDTQIPDTRQSRR